MKDGERRSSPLPPRQSRQVRVSAGLPFFIEARYMREMRILVVEDDSEAGAYLVKAFREQGHVADHAADGLEGYAAAAEGRYDVLIIDRMLPKLDGLSLISGLREQKIDTPALILSALGQVDDRVRGLRAGGDDYVSKPYAFSELLARVEALARRRGGPKQEETVYESAISSSIASPIRSSRPDRRSCCSRASSVCWNIS